MNDFKFILSARIARGPIPLDEAYFKLRALGLAADRLRQRFG